MAELLFLAFDEESDDDDGGDEAPPSVPVRVSGGPSKSLVEEEMNGFDSEDDL